MNSRTQEEIDRNIEVHDRTARQYDARHGEIFNEIEQKRLRAALQKAVSMVHGAPESFTALDVGCGSGNLSRHMIDLGLQVIAADVSQGFLDLVKHRFAHKPLRTVKLNGHDLSNIETGCCELVAAYSVLHHIPDYLGAVDEMARVCAPGGVVFIDHELTDEFWKGDPVYELFQKRALRIDWRKYLVASNYIDRLRRIRDPKFSNEGDIHVWQDDHIEWQQIDERLLKAGFDCVHSADYLLFRKLYRPWVYAEFADRCTDMRNRIYRKRLGEPAAATA
jgi:ubiquinone/menaquinone biosynthesis C-methylase UbiE